MKNYIQEGRMITVAAPAGGVTSGDGVVIGSLFGVASKTAAAGETVTIATEGVFDLPKLASGHRRRQCGRPGRYREGGRRAGHRRYPIGIAIEAAGSGVTKVRVRLDGIATAAAA